MKRRIFASVVATAAVAASLLITSAAPAVAEPATAAADSSAAARGTGVTPNSGLPDAIRITDPTLKIVATLKGIGSQVYTCTNGTYTLREPVAVLVNLRTGNAGIHGQGPFWASFDGSRVNGTPDGSLPQTGTQNVAWLRLKGASVANAPGVFGNVKFIQRLDTRGGVAPATCGATDVSVGYTANYVFWGPK